jgi:hypothetical protein
LSYPSSGAVLAGKAACFVKSAPRLAGDKSIIRRRQKAQVPVQRQRFQHVPQPVYASLGVEAGAFQGQQRCGYRPASFTGNTRLLCLCCNLQQCTLPEGAVSFRICLSRPAEKENGL